MQNEKKLALNGGEPVRTKSWPLMYPGGTMYDEEEVNAAGNVIKAQSPFRHYGVNLLNRVSQFEESMSVCFGK